MEWGPCQVESHLYELWWFDGEMMDTWVTGHWAVWNSQWSVCNVDLLG